MTKSKQDLIDECWEKILSATGGNEKDAYTSLRTFFKSCFESPKYLKIIDDMANSDVLEAVTEFINKKRIYYHKFQVHLRSEEQSSNFINIFWSNSDSKKEDT